MRDAEREFLALGDLERIGAVVKSQQLMTAMTAISGALGSFWNSMGDILRAGQEEARTVALTTSMDWDTPLLRMGLPAEKRRAMKAELISLGRYNVEAMLARIYKTRLPLSQQVYKTAALSEGWVETRIDSGLARGLSVKDMAKEVRDFVNPGTKGGAAYAAKRLARTEINSAYHAVTIGANEDKPWNLGMQWNLSGSHPTVDICDEYARNNHAQLGRGVFPKDAVPRKPHPQCLCHVAPKTITPEQWLERYRAGEFDQFIDATYGVKPT